MVIAPGRARRPGAARAELEPPTEEELRDCPFCAGREDRTPPETLRIGDPWRVRVVPNLYPAFERQEVVVHSPEHVRSIAELGGEQLELVADAWRERARASRAEGFAYVHTVVNEGRDAGASLPHSHSQLIWMRDVPPVPAAEAGGRRCAICAWIERERAEGARVVSEQDGLICFCPYAGRGPYELAVAPVEHEPDAFSSGRLGSGLRLAAEALRRVHDLEGPRPANLWLHDSGHWHLELLPRLTVFAGIELGAGIWINPLAPEDAAAALRAAAPASPPPTPHPGGADSG